MSTTMTERTKRASMKAEESYLRDIGRRLKALTPEQRDAVLDDVRAHFAEAADAGRSPEQAAESLGDPAQLTERVRDELGHESDRTDRIRRVLLWLTTGVAVFTAMFLSFWNSDGSVSMPNTQFEAHGFGGVLLNLAPALVAALPILATTRARPVFTAAVAILLTVVSFVFPESWAFVPTAMLAWAALGTPAVVRNGRPAAAWRIAGGVLTALPASLGFIGMLNGAFGTDVWSLLITVISLGLGVLIALGKPWAGILVAVGGGALLVYSALDPGYIVLATWWAGGLFLTIGASHALMLTRLRTPARQG
ncbi:DUF1700 domain-containing protein [Promicromonospora sp. NPDC050249]|uniref:DUF1700 domain-containing protein n=1 Tax=Promicromonospora sp. NPDC050249 TaxID=3154743 RepID=UPI0033C5AA11